MGTFAVLAGLAIGAFALLGGSSRRGTRRTPVDSPQPICGYPASRAATLSESERFAWLECDGRTPADAAAMVASLRRTDAEAASRAESRWNAIREVVNASADGSLVSPEAQSEAQAVERGESVSDTASSVTTPPSTGRQSGPNDATARRLVGPLVRALSRRRSYRQTLMDFQRAAGIVPDGRYGGRTYNAIRFFGGNPPPPFEGPAPDSSDAVFRGLVGPVSASGSAGRMSDALAHAKG